MSDEKWPPADAPQEKMGRGPVIPAKAGIYFRDGHRPSPV